MKVFVIGMHRSGTSMVAGILHGCGLNLGNIYLEGDDNNPRGYFEDRRFIQINHNILIQNKGEWNSPPWQIQSYPGLKEEMQEFLGQWDSRETVVLKGPRTCLTFPLWYEAISPLEPIKAIVTMRPISEIAASLEKRDGIPIQEGKRLAKFYVRSALMSLYRFNIPFISVSYHNFFRDWQSELNPILKFIGHDFPADTRPIEEFIDINLWHHREGKRG